MYRTDVTNAWHAEAPAQPPGGGIMSPYASSSISLQTLHSPSQRPMSRMKSAVLRTSLRQSNGSDGQMVASMGCAFDKHALGDDLPSSAHAPEPERPVSRNATARANMRERERQRAHSSLSTRNSMSLFDYNRDQIEQQRMQKEQEDTDRMQAQSVLQSHTPLLSRSPSRIRHDSSPAFGNTWSSYASSSMAEMPPPSQMPLHRTPSQLSAHYTSPQPPAQDHYYAQQPAPSHQYVWPQQDVYAAPQPQHEAAYYHQNAPAQLQPTYSSHSYGQPHVVASPSQYDGASWQSQTHSYSQESTEQRWPTLPDRANSVGHAPQSDYAPSLISGTSSTASSPYPPTPHLQTWSSGPSPASDCGYSSASPSRSSSRSSTVSRAHSTVSSTSSVSGTVRRALPQPPSAPVTNVHISAQSPSTPQKPQNVGDESSDVGNSTITASSINTSVLSLSRHDSMRLAAEEIMARGSPRRRGMIPTKMRGSAEKPELPAASAAAASSSPRNIIEARSQSTAEDLERAMSTLHMKDGPRQEPAEHDAGQFQPTPIEHSTLERPTPQKNFAPRAASPRPMRAYPAPSPSVSMAAPGYDALPDRPRSRGPKDESEERKMSMMELPIAPPMPARSPPPDRRIPDFGASDNTGPAGMNVPMITVGVADEEEQQRQHRPSPPAAAPMPAHHGHHTHSHAHVQCHGDSAGPAPQASISISQSSGNVAQRSTTTMPGQPASLSRHNGRSGMFGNAPAPVSASAVGSGASCSTCRKWISGRVVHAMNHNFHPECFGCDHCGENLEHVAFYEHEGRAYCHFDYHELFSKRCFHCRTPIVDQRYITINDVELTTGNGQQGQVQERCYHDMHFFCANCGDPFLDPKLASDAAGRDPLAQTIEDENGTVRYGGREFVVHKGYPYCERCHVSLHKPKCKGCRLPIVDAEYLTALNAKWHVGCFCCEACKRPIDDDNFFVRDNVAYDEHCYKIKLRSEL